jgi:hypothetical protein
MSIAADRITEERRLQKLRKDDPTIAQQSIADVKERIATAKQGIAYWESQGNAKNVLENRQELKMAEGELARLEATLPPPPDDAA